MVVEDPGVQENVVHYDDEGGGEEDTEAFSMLALRPLSQQKQSRGPAHSDRLFQQLIKERLQQAHLDSAAPPCDSLQTYAFEGSAPSAASFSSLDSPNAQERNYELLKDWGPPFWKLADLYGNHEGVGGVL